MRSHIVGVELSTIAEVIVETGETAKYIVDVMMHMDICRRRPATASVTIFLSSVAIP